METKLGPRDLSSLQPLESLLTCVLGSLRSHTALIVSYFFSVLKWGLRGDIIFTNSERHVDLNLLVTSDPSV